MPSVAASLTHASPCTGHRLGGHSITRRDARSGHTLLAFPQRVPWPIVVQPKQAASLYGRIRRVGHHVKWRATCPCIYTEIALYLRASRSGPPAAPANAPPTRHREFLPRRQDTRSFPSRRADARRRRADRCAVHYGQRFTGLIRSLRCRRTKLCNNPVHPLPSGRSECGDLLECTQRGWRRGIGTGRQRQCGVEIGDSLLDQCYSGFARSSVESTRLAFSSRRLSAAR